MTLVGFACWLFGEWGGPDVTRVVSCVGSVAFSALACGCVLAVARVNRGRRQAAWAILAVGLGGWVVGDLVWAYYQLVLHTYPPYPSAADFAYLLLPIAACVSWIVNVSGTQPRFVGFRPLLDGVIVSSSLFMLAWSGVLRNIFASDDGHDLHLAVALMYPVADLVMVTMALVVMSSVAPGNRRPLAILTSGLTTIALADCAMVVLNAHDVRSHSAVVIAWAAGLLLIGAGALYATDARRPDVTRRRSGVYFWLPYVPIPPAVITGAVALWTPSPDDLPILIAGLALITAALIRQLTVLIENRALLETVADNALRDPLTGLANRLLFSDRLAHAMQLRDRDGREVAVLSLDLDDFKLVNDNLGTPRGDALLRSVADRLMSAIPTGDTVARLGGDEFAIVIEGDPDAESVAQRVVEVFDKPFFLDSEEVYIHPSVGLATAPSPADGDISPDELFRRADLAMYTAKRAGIGGVQTFSFDMRQVDRDELRTSVGDGVRRRTSVAGIQLLGQLRRAIDDGELTLVYQPKVSLCSAHIVGVEALIRWPHPELGMLSPNQFLPLVRKNGLMGAVTDVVLDIAARDAATWYRTSTCELPVAINLFAPSLNDMTLPERIGGALTRANLPPAALSVEITEHLLLANIRRATTVIERLRAKGVRIAIDDFGSGYATMSYLRDLPIDELKLDRQFIAPVLRSERAAAIVRSVIDLAHALGIVCVAEGVEDRATADRLHEYGCDIAQGHYFARPMDVDALRAQIELNSSAIFPITN